MITRYEVKEISQLWTDEFKFKKYLEVELALLETLEEKNIIPKNTIKQFSNVKINPTRIKEIEETTQHDVIAFCTSITEQVPSSASRFFHFGVTSSDIIDTAHSLIIKENLNIIENDMKNLGSAIWKKMEETSDLICLGRSHGITAEAMIFGQKFASFYAELQRRFESYQNFQQDLTGQLSGAVGNYTVLNPEIEDLAIKKLGLKTEVTSTQIIPRDHYAKIIQEGALIASLLERMSTEFRLLQHSDVAEVSEGFSAGQKGSSTMPHKKNPISSENITGLARLLRSHTIVALENCSLWHERDISHSSNERLILPDHFGLLSYMLKRMTSLVENLVIHREHIENKVKNNFHIFSSYLLHHLLVHAKDESREEIYQKVQELFFSAKNFNTLNEQLKKLELNNLALDMLTFQKLKIHYIQQFILVKNRLTKIN